MSAKWNRPAPGARLIACIAALVLSGPLAAGCPRDGAGVDDGAVETAHLRITTSTDNPICAGTPLLLESEVVRIAEALELPLWPEDDKLDTRFGFDSVAEICPQYDPDDISGCVDSSEDEMVLAAKEIVLNAPHELVHAVRLHSFPLGPSLFEEGIAQVLSGSDGFPLYASYPHGDPFTGPVELLDVPGVEPGHYVTGQSFVSWLWETHDRATLMAFMNDPRLPDDDAVFSLFEEHFGQTLQHAEQAWRHDDRPDPIWGAPCIPERTYSLADGPLELSGELDCREPTVYGASSSMSLWPMCLDVPATTRVRLLLDADHGRFYVVSREPCEPGPVGAEALRSKYLDAGDVLEEDIAGCRYRMGLNSQEPGFPPTPYTIRIEEID